MREGDYENYENPEKERTEEVPVFTDRDFEGYLDIEGEPSKEEGEPEEVAPLPEIHDSLRSRKRSKRSLIFVALLCFAFGIVILLVFFMMKPEVKRPKIVAKRLTRSIPPAGQREEQKIPGTIGGAGEEENVLPGGIQEAGGPSVPKPPGASLVSREREAAKKLVVIEGTQPAGEKGEEGTAKAEGEKAEKEPEGKEAEATKPMVAKVEESKVQAVPEGKLPTGRFTINVASFKERKRADRLVDELKEKGYLAFVAKATIPQKGTWYRVSVGRFSTRKEAQAFARAVKEKEGMDSFVRETGEVEK